MKAIFKVLFILTIFTNSINSYATDGVLIISKSKDLSSNQVTTSKLYLTSSMLKIENSGNDNSSMIFDAEKEIFTFIDNRKKEYYQFDEPTLRQLKEQLKMIVQMMKQFSSQMPEDQQKKLDKILNPNAESPIDYSLIGDAKVSNWDTKKYNGTADNEKILELNIASFQSIGIDESKFSVMKSLVDFFKENLQEVASMLPTNQSMSAISFDENSPILKTGLPVRTISYDGGEANSETLVQSITESPIDESQFSIPSGYARKTINMQKQFEK
ncbi:hypothetical protein N6H18_09380 [Reichenbachiella agarivorans]|uniref:DUF4412 domain-containing protein n=1 Tax=Reichenbachiella agarivorans TaxID=2979464 RepID=A0ABY6CKF5_9BACT|nr:hypothetical protein [Reichenbachiella agarivorans]UXP30565.1 hypothetical protein N6H18_09380 [Reichenbachiella agarivorans]